MLSVIEFGAGLKVIGLGAFVGSFADFLNDRLSCSPKLLRAILYHCRPRVLFTGFLNFEGLLVNSLLTPGVLHCGVVRGVVITNGFHVREAVIFPLGSPELDFGYGLGMSGMLSHAAN